MRAHCNREWAKLRSPNKMSLVAAKASFPWYRDPDGPNFAAAHRATVAVHGVPPCYTREGGSIPIVSVFEEACDATCVLLPIGASDDGAHAQNEKIDRANYINGVTTTPGRLNTVPSTRVPRLHSPCVPRLASHCGPLLHVVRGACVCWCVQVKTLGCYLDELACAGKKSDAADPAAAASRAASRSWRRRCKQDPSVYGCECLSCQLPGESRL